MSDGSYCVYFRCRMGTNTQLTPKHNKQRNGNTSPCCLHGSNIYSGFRFWKRNRVLTEKQRTKEPIFSYFIKALPIMDQTRLERFIQVCTKALYEGVKEAFCPPHTHKQTEDQSHKKRALFKSITQNWRLAGFFKTFLYSDSALKTACTSELLPAAEHGREYDSVSYFWAVSVTKAMTSQLCFHSFM